MDISIRKWKIEDAEQLKNAINISGLFRLYMIEYTNIINKKESTK